MRSEELVSSFIESWLSISFSGMPRIDVKRDDMSTGYPEYVVCL